MMSIGEGARREAVEQIKLLGYQQHPDQATSAHRRQACRSRTPFRERLDLRRRPADPDRFPVPAGRCAAEEFVDTEVRFEGHQGVAQVIGTSPEYEIDEFSRGGRPVSHRLRPARYQECLYFGLGGQARAVWASRRPWSRSPGRRDMVHSGQDHGAQNDARGRATVIKVLPINRDIYLPSPPPSGGFHDWTSCRH